MVGQNKTQITKWRNKYIYMKKIYEQTYDAFIGRENHKTKINIDTEANLFSKTTNSEELSISSIEKKKK